MDSDKAHQLLNEKWIQKSFTTESCKDSIYGKQIVTTRYELHDKATYTLKIQELKDKITVLTDSIKKIKVDIAAFTNCTESDCDKYGDCQCVDTMRNCLLSFRNDIKYAKEDILLLERLRDFHYKESIEFD